MLSVPDLDLKKAVDICRASEYSKKQINNVNNGDNIEETIHKVNVNKPYYKQGTGARPKQSQAQPNYRHPGTTSRQSQRTQYSMNCNRCGRQHPPRSCPAWGRQCNKCKRPNHFAEFCRTGSTVDAVDEELNELFIGGIGDDGNRRDEWWVNLHIKKSRVALKIDTGAKANLISHATYKKVAPNATIKKTNNRLVTYSGQSIPVVGVCTLKVNYKGGHCKLDFYIVTKGQSILGLKAAVELGLIQRVDQVKSKKTRDRPIIEEYDDVFNGIGCMPNEHHIQLKDEAEPVVHAPRRVPFALNERLKEELDRLSELGIIVKVDYPTEWVNSLVIVEKPNGKLRLCLDPKELNQASYSNHRGINEQTRPGSILFYT
jgi:hypothetical protein